VDSLFHWRPLSTSDLPPASHWRSLTITGTLTEAAKAHAVGGRGGDRSHFSKKERKKTDKPREGTRDGGGHRIFSNAPPRKKEENEGWEDAASAFLTYLKPLKNGYRNAEMGCPRVAGALSSPTAGRAARPRAAIHTTDKAQATGKEFYKHNSTQVRTRGLARASTKREREKPAPLRRQMERNQIDSPN